MKRKERKEEKYFFHFDFSRPTFFFNFPPKNLTSEVCEQANNLIMFLLPPTSIPLL